MKRLLFAACLLGALNASAYDFAVENSDKVRIYYNKISETEVEVTNNNARYYTGKVVVPETATYEDTTYRVTKVGNYAFYECYELTEVVLPNSVKSIGDWGIGKNPRLTKVTLSNSLTSMGASCLGYAEGLPTLTIPNSVTDIEYYAFTYCTSLTEITLSNSITRIKPYTFQGCRSLKEITLPASIANIEEYAFRGCSDLQKVYCLAPTPPTMGSLVFEVKLYDEGTLYVPIGCKSKYQKANVWEEFANIVEMDMTGIDTPENPAAKGIYYDLSGREVDQPTKGIYILDGKKVVVK